MVKERVSQFIRQIGGKCGEPILLNYNFKMELLPWEKLDHGDKLSQLIPKYKEPLEVTVMASQQKEVEIKKNPHVMLYGIFQLPLMKSGEKLRTTNS